jgi:hypothetical protein
MDLNLIFWEGVDWINMIRVASCCEHGDEQLGSLNCQEFLD